MPDSRFYEGCAPVNLDQVCEWLELEQLPQSEKRIQHLATLSSAKQNDLTYFADAKLKTALQNSSAGFCLVSAENANLLPKQMVAVIVDDPQKAFVCLLQKMYRMHQPFTGISDHAMISETASIGPGTTVGPFTSIADGAQIGQNCFLDSHVAIGPGVMVGDNTVVLSHSSLNAAHIGADCILHNGVRIGQAGFGFLPGPTGHTAIPQVGCVIIEKGCNIGANVTIDRGALDNTKIGHGSIIDNQVHIAHNVTLGQYCILAGQTGISGSVTVGDFVIMGGQVGVADHITIGSGAQIAAKTGLLSDIAPGEKVMGYPARSVKQFFREVATLKKLSQKKERST